MSPCFVVVFGQHDGGGESVKRQMNNLLYVAYECNGQSIDITQRQTTDCSKVSVSVKRHKM